MAITKDGKKISLGQAAIEARNKTPDTRDPIELEHEMHKDYDKHISECIDRCKNEFPGDFFIIVETKRERSPILNNVIRNLFFGRLTCPTPTYDQTVYKFNRKSDSLEFIWVLPSKEACEYLRDNRAKVHPNEYQLLEFVLGLYDDTLIKLCKKLNGEKLETPELEVN